MHASQVFLTATHLVLVMEYAAGGDLAQYVAARQGLCEPEARHFFQQLIVALDYCHRMVRAHGCTARRPHWVWRVDRPGCLPAGCRHPIAVGPPGLACCVGTASVRGCWLQGVSSRDIKLENVLLDGSPRPLIKVSCAHGSGWRRRLWQSSVAQRAQQPAQLPCGQRRRVPTVWSCCQASCAVARLQPRIVHVRAALPCCRQPSAATSCLVAACRPPTTSPAASKPAAG